MRYVIAAIGLTIVIVAAWAAFVLPGSAGPAIGSRRSGRNGRQLDGRPKPKRALSGSGPAGLAAAAWPIFRGAPDMRGVAAGSLSRSMRLLWRSPTSGSIKSSAIIGGGRVFVGSDDGGVYALDAADGTKLWSFKTAGAVEAPPLLLGETVFVGSKDSFLYALEARSGRMKWKYETGGEVIGSASWAPGSAGQAPRILLGGYDNRLYCLDAETGEKIWTYETGGYIYGPSPAVADGRAVFGACDGRIHVVSVSDGLASLKIDVGSNIVATAALAGNRAYVGNYGNEFLCVDVSTGEIVWKYTGGDGPFIASAAVGPDRVVAGSADSSLHCIDRETGAAIWVFRTGGGVNSSAVICGDKVIVGSDDGRLYLLRLSDGAELWSYDMGSPVRASPAVAGGMVIVGCQDGWVYAFGPE